MSVYERFAPPKDEVNRIALILMAEKKQINPSYVSNFADMARAVIAAGYKRDEEVAEQVYDPPIRWAKPFGGSDPRAKANSGLYERPE